MKRTTGSGPHDNHRVANRPAYTPTILIAAALVLASLLAARAEAAGPFIKESFTRVFVAPDAFRRRCAPTWR